MNRTPRFRRAAFRAILAAASFAMLASPPARAAETWLEGNLSEVTTVGEGLLIRMDNGLPTQCTGTPFGWMLIPEANKTMLAMTMMLWMSGKRSMVIYTRAYTGDGYCTITQVDPAG